jgi:hypothetical protein
MSLDECYRVLGVPRSASAAEVTAAYRRLAKRHHPDVNPTRESCRRFIEVSAAYAELREWLRDVASPIRRDRCPHCGRLAKLHRPLAGIEGCADCLLGRTYRSRFLPLPVVVVARHLSVVAFYAVGILFLVLYVRSNDWHQAVISFLAVMAGIALLAGEVLSLAGSNPRPRGVSRGRSAPRASG